MYDSRIDEEGGVVEVWEPLDTDTDDVEQDVWPLPPSQMIAARYLVEKLIQLEPGSSINVDRQFVLDNWPNVRPLF